MKPARSFALAIWSVLVISGIGFVGPAVSAPAADTSDVPAWSSWPDPLTKLNGERVTSRKQWVEKRRPELKLLFEQFMYGAIPPKPDRIEFTTNLLDGSFLSGKATLKVINIGFGSPDAPRIDLMLVIPNALKVPAPVFLAMNFCGNHAVASDPRIPLTRGWLYSSCRGCSDNRATDAARGGQAADWPLETIVERGFALATFCSSDVDSDRADVSDGVYSWLAMRKTGSAANAPTHHRGCIAGWAWGFHRCVDYLVTDRDLDANRIAAVGHSRNGKTALLAAAFDERIAISFPHQAGCGGTAPSRVAPALAAPRANGRPTAETIAVINQNFPHWFNAEFKKFNEHPDKLPFDQHCLVALMAPRPVLLSNAQEDQWANPSGQFEVLRAAESVYRLVNAGGLAAKQMPELGRLVDSKLGYYIRAGRHSMTSDDWGVFLRFAEKHWAN
jgi:hypothetical protein